MVMCKGADSIILPLLHPDSENVDKTIKTLESFSKEGLRTLLIAEKEISEFEYNTWNQKYQQALLATKNREQKVDEVSAEIEHGFYLIGSTAIEDMLQEDVADTIDFMKKAGIKVWVLTGDKIETAINIGVSCKLLSPQMEIFIVDKRATGEIRSQILDHQKIQKLTDKARDNAVVVAGDSLIKIVKNETVKEDFL